MNDADWLSADRAARLLEVRKPTLYAYVSRGLLRARKAGAHSSYSRQDVELLRARSSARKGNAAVAGGALLWGEPVLDTRVSSMSLQGPEYRGHAAIALARDNVSAERVGELLWTGVLPAHACWPSVPREWLAQAAPVVAGHHSPLLAMLAAVASLPPWPRLDPEAELTRARSLVRCLATIPALRVSLANGQRAARAATLAQSLLHAEAQQRPRKRDQEHSTLRERAVECALVVLADHELNASAFAARVAAGAGADLPRCLCAALGTLSGDRHGGAAERIGAWVDAFTRPEQALTWVRAELGARRAIPGFGHTLYPDGDPRTAPLLEAAEQLKPDDLRVRALRVASDAMALAGAERATVDVGLVALASALGWSPQAATALFAVGRSLGYVAHILEQREQGHLLRPRARYVGKTL